MDIRSCRLRVLRCRLRDGQRACRRVETANLHVLPVRVGIGASRRVVAAAPAPTSPADRTLSFLPACWIFPSEFPVAARRAAWACLCLEGPRPPETPTPASQQPRVAMRCSWPPGCRQSLPSRTPPSVLSLFITEVVVPFHRKYSFTYLPSQAEGEPPEARDRFSCVLESLAPNQAKCLYTGDSQGERT